MCSSRHALGLRQKSKAYWNRLPDSARGKNSIRTCEKGKCVTMMIVIIKMIIIMKLIMSDSDNDCDKE